MRRKLSLLCILILIFYVVVTPCLKVNIFYKDGQRHYLENSSRSVRAERNCRSTSVNPGIMDRLSLSYNQFFYTIFERKEILHEEFESVVVEPKFRPQSARSNMTDGNTNKRLLFKADYARMMKGDFVTM